MSEVQLQLSVYIRWWFKPVVVVALILAHYGLIGMNKRARIASWLITRGIVITSA